MARSSVVTKLPLDRFAEFVGIHPLHFNQLIIGDIQNTHCGQGWFQHDWQDHDRVSRDDVARAIKNAEDDIEHALGYRLLPAWEVEELHATIRPIRPESFNLSATDIRGMAASVRADWGYFISGGIEARTLIEAGAAIVATDEDSDTYFETCTVTTTVPDGTDACEIACYYPGKSGASAWEIRPISVSIVGTTATITFRRELAVVEAELDKMPITEEHRPRGLDATNDLNFLDEVDVYRHWNDPQTQGTLVWEGSSCGSCSACTVGTQTACLLAVRSGRLPHVSYRAATWDADAGEFTAAGLASCRAPDAIYLNYYGGLRDRSLGCAKREMDEEWARTVAIYAAALLDRSVCECSTVQAGVQRWQQDLAFSRGADELAEYKLSDEDKNNPFGTKRGAIYAWRRVSRAGAAIGRGA